MHLTANPMLLAALWHEMNRTARAPSPARVARSVELILKAGWASTSRIEDLLFDIGLSNTWDVRNLLEAFHIPSRPVFPRPTKLVSYCAGGDEVSAADLAAFLIYLERIGLPVDPSPLVSAIAPAIGLQPMLTVSDLAVFWFARERHRCEPVTFDASPPADAGPRTYQEVRLPTGYKAAAILHGEAAQSVTVTAPKYRQRRREHAPGHLQVNGYGLPSGRSYSGRDRTMTSAASVAPI